MSAKFVPVESPLSMTDRELRETLGDLPDSTLMRTLIMAEVQAIRNGAERETRTMRNLWYDHIKPVLSRLGFLDRQTAAGNDLRWDGLLSKYLAELVRAGATSYDELCIIDGSRQRQIAVNVIDAIVSTQLVGAHYPWLVIFTEKDTMWQAVEGVATLYGVSAISGAGEPSNACTHNMVSEILERGDHDIVLLSLTDYDPSGYIIAEAQYNQLVEAVAGRCEVHHRRIGLYPSQLDQEQRAQKAYKPPAKGLAEWFARTGGVDGKPLGLELDALSLSVLRGMYAEAIEQYVDLNLKQTDLREAFINTLACDILLPDFERRREAMRAAARDSGLWDTMTIPDNLFRLVAGQGWDRVRPAVTTIGGKPLFDCEEPLRAMMIEALNGGEV